VDKADVLTGNQREIMIWGKNNIIVDMNMMLDSERKDHHNELAAICKHLTQSDAKLSESDKKHEIELADVRILATAEVDDLLKKKITQFNWKLGCSEENQEAWRVKIADKDNLINNLEQKIKYQAESMHNLRDNLSEAKNQLVDKMAEQPVSKKSRI
jgi:chromosome segregation ATPase